MGRGARGAGRRRARAAGRRSGRRRVAVVRSRPRAGRAAAARGPTPTVAARSSFTFTTPSGCATRAARRRSSRATRRRRAGSRERLRPTPPRAAGAARAWARSRPITPTRVYLDGVARVLEYLRGGRRLSGEPVAPAVAPRSAGRAAVELAAALRARAPAPHAAFIAAARRRRRAASATRPSGSWPLDGRRRGRDAPDQGDAAARRRRRRRSGGCAPRWPPPAKDRAEHVMIVDLERNDLGRVCRTGSVEVDGAGARGGAADGAPPGEHRARAAARRTSAWPRCWRRRSRAARSPARPSGAPCRSSTSSSRRARGPYTGATGWLGAAGDLDLAVAIRTALVRGGRLSLSVGGGIVADSTPEGELAETEVKARAFARAVRRRGPSFVRRSLTLPGRVASLVFAGST